MEQIYKDLVKGLKQFKKDNKVSRVVIGLSGGLDSAVVAVLAADVFGAGNVYGVAMPSKHTSCQSNDCASQLAGNLGLNYCVLPIEEQVALEEKELLKHFAGGLNEITKQNLQARMRGLTLMAFANQLSAVVLATGNKSEIYTGYCTLYGDTCGALAPIGDVYKSTLYHLAEFINRNGEVIPQYTIDRAPSAELAPNQKDQDTLPPYDLLDNIIEEYIFNSKAAAEIAQKLKADKKLVADTIQRIDGSAFKRKQLAPVISLCKTK